MQQLFSLNSANQFRGELLHSATARVSKESCAFANQPLIGKISYPVKCSKALSGEFSNRSSSNSTAFDDKDNFLKTFMQEVPDEILDLILVYAVRGHKDMRSLALTCTRWKKFAEQDVAWKRLSVRGWGNRADIIQIPIDKESTISWYDYYKSRILSHSPEVSYMKRQQHLTVSIRSILINWLLAVIDEFQHGEDLMSLPQAHHQTVSLFDSFCARQKGAIQTNELQMIGAACAVIALNPDDEVDDIDSSYFEKASFYTDGACTAEEIVAVSRKIFDVLDLGDSFRDQTACQQIDLLLTAMQKNYPSSSTYCLSHYLGELALQAETSLKFSSMTIGTASYALACHTLGWSESIWMPIIRNKTYFSSLTQLQPCMTELQGLLRQALSMLTRRSKKGNLPHVIVKYSRRERQHVAKVIVTPTAWPTVCPHGFCRDIAMDSCDLCIAEAAAASGPDDSEMIFTEDTMDGGAGNVFDQHDATESDEQEADGEDSDPEIAEPSRTGPAQTPHGNEFTVASAASSMSPHQRTQSRPEQPVLGGDQSLPASAGSVAACTSGRAPQQQQPEFGAHTLQDVSFGAISETNDNSFNACGGELVLEEDGVLSSADRRASLTSVLHAVDEEGPDAFAFSATGTTTNHF